MYLLYIHYVFAVLSVTLFTVMLLPFYLNVPSFVLLYLVYFDVYYCAFS